jgi:hypothetical protein
MSNRLQRARAASAPNFPRLTRDPTGLAYFGSKATGYRVSLIDNTVIGHVTVTNERVHASANFLWRATTPDGLALPERFLSRADAGDALRTAHTDITPAVSAPAYALAS